MARRWPAGPESAQDRDIADTTITVQIASGR
jgi:hypothetical protein